MDIYWYYSTTCAAVNNTSKKRLFRNFAPFNSCITKINITQVDNAEDIDKAMPMKNLIEYSIVYLSIYNQII